MSVQMIPHSGVDQHPDTTHITSQKDASQRSEVLSGALSRAEAGFPAVPYHAKHEEGRCSCHEGTECRDPGKHPVWKKSVLENGYNSATRSESKITTLWNSMPWANLGVNLHNARVRGRRVAVVDIESVEGHGVDGREALRGLEAERGELPATYTERTANGGEHREYLLPEGFEPEKSENPAPGIELLVQGGMVVAPSRGYEVIYGGERAELPPAWVELLSGVSRPRKDTGSGRKRHPELEVLDSRDPISEGTRNKVLTSICGRLHDGTRDLGQLIEDLAAVNEERCDSPQPRPEVEKIARSIHKKPPCEPPRSREVLELVEELGRRWWGVLFPGIGGKTLASMLRALIREGERIGTVLPGVGLRVQISVRALAEIVGCHPNTIVNATKRARAAGILRKDDGLREGTNAGAFVLLARPTCDNQTTPPPTEGRVVGVSQPSRVSVAELRTEHYRWRGHVGKGRERALCALEAFGPQTVEELADRLGWKRARDLRVRYLGPLAALGLVEDRGGVWALPGDYCERQEDVRSEPYSTVRLRARRVHSAEGRRLTVVEESGVVASEVERGRLDRLRHERQREVFRARFFGPAFAEARPEGAGGEPEHRDLVGWVEEPRPEPVPSSPMASLPDEEVADLEAILAYEAAHGNGSFGWDRASCKRMFYGGPVRGRWPDPETLARIKAAYDELEKVAV